MTEVSTHRPSEVRQLSSPAALALADLAGVFEDLQIVLSCCERMMNELAAPDRSDELLIESLWTTALLAYARCFEPGERGQGLTPQDVTATGLSGDVLGWHQTLDKLRAHYTDVAHSPHASFAVGAARDADGVAEGVAVTSATTPLIDTVTVRQTGALAFELSRIVDGRIASQQEVVFASLDTMSPEELDELPLLALTEAD